MLCWRHPGEEQKIITSLTSLPIQFPQELFSPAPHLASPQESTRITTLLENQRARLEELVSGSLPKRFKEDKIIGEPSFSGFTASTVLLNATKITSKLETPFTTRHRKHYLDGWCIKLSLVSSRPVCDDSILKTGIIISSHRILHSSKTVTVLFLIWDGGFTSETVQARAVFTYFLSETVVYLSPALATSRWCIF